MKIVAFLPAKGTSERLPSKNTKILFGKPLFLHSLEKLLNCKFIDEVYLDSEDDKILDMYDHLPYKKFKRSPELASNVTDGNSLFYNECKNIDADIYIELMGTAPLLSETTIQKAVDILLSNPAIDSVVCARKEKLYSWNESAPLYNVNFIPNSKDIPASIAENMSLYVVRKNVILTSRRRIGDHPYLLFVDKIESIDIDSQEDFSLAEAVLSTQAHNEKLYFEKIKHLLNSELLSDVLDSLGIHNRVFKLNCNLPCKIMGRAKTLKLKKIEQENYEKIYEAIDYYEYINHNNILCVENEVKNFAYFGELNALMSVARGCLGTIVAGTTRDLKEVTAMNYPVFYENNHCQDVKCRAVLDYYDKPITIQNIQIRPDDLIYADHEGGIVFPRSQEKQIIDKALDGYLAEKNIAFEFAHNKDIKKHKF